MFYVLNDGDHFHVLSQELNSLHQTMKRESEGNNLQILPVGNNYYINPKPQTPKYIIIENEEDIYNEIVILDKEKKKDEKITINAIHRGDNLEQLLWNLVIDKQYIPTVEFDAGNINSIGLSFNKDIKVYIKQQQLVKSEIDGIVKVDNVTTYNNLSETFNDFKFKVLRPEHKSYYSQLDIDEIHECRTTPNTGLAQAI